MFSGIRIKASMRAHNTVKLHLFYYEMAKYSQECDRKVTLVGEIFVDSQVQQLTIVGR